MRLHVHFRALLLVSGTVVLAGAAAAPSPPPSDSYTYGAGFLAAGDDLPGGSFAYASALAHCDALVECSGDLEELFWEPTKKTWNVEWDLP